jgi:hypothetical protein
MGFFTRVAFLVQAIPDACVIRQGRGLKVLQHRWIHTAGAWKQRGKLRIPEQ